MKRRLLLLTIGLLVAAPGFSQMRPSGTPLTEVFVGASYFRSDISRGNNLAGWQAAVDYNIFKHVGFVLDFGGQYKSVNGTTLSLYEYMGGPRFKYRTGRATAFLEGLVGGNVTRLPFGSSIGRFAAGVGGGLDLNLGRHVAFRVFQIDWIPDERRGEFRHNLRAAVGVVFKLPSTY